MKIRWKLFEQWAKNMQRKSDRFKVTFTIDYRLVRRHTGVQVYSGIYLERRYAVPAAGTRYLIS